ncbi:hypothetical protein FOA52_011503 [Chlamydomonas sp. UWO 241]|nr:hypothetical protein FOA52_011503 [Chlamydomonas sp. UWO 241]
MGGVRHSTSTRADSLHAKTLRRLRALNAMRAACGEPPCEEFWREPGVALSRVAVVSALGVHSGWVFIARYEAQSAGEFAEVVALARSLCALGETLEQLPVRLQASGLEALRGPGSATVAHPGAASRAAAAVHATAAGAGAVAPAQAAGLPALAPAPAAMPASASATHSPGTEGVKRKLEADPGAEESAAAGARDVRAKPEVAPPTSDTLTIVVKKQTGSDVHFTLRPSTHLSKVIDAHCAQKAIEPATMRFMFNNCKLPLHATPHILGMEDGNVIDAMVGHDGC